MRYFIILLVLIYGAATFNVKYVLAPVEIKQSPNDTSKMIAIVPEKVAKVVIKFDKIIQADVEQTEQFKATFKVPKVKISKMLKLSTLDGTVKKPTIVNIEDKKTGEKLAVMIMSEKVDAATR